MSAFYLEEKIKTIFDLINEGERGITIDELEQQLVKKRNFIY